MTDRAFSPPLSADSGAFFDHIERPLLRTIDNVDGNAKLSAEDREEITDHIKRAIEATARAIQKHAR